MRGTTPAQMGECALFYDTWMNSVPDNSGITLTKMPPRDVLEGDESGIFGEVRTITAKPGGKYERKIGMISFLKPSRDVAKSHARPF